MLDTATMITAGSDRAAAVVLTRTMNLDRPRSELREARLRAADAVDNGQGLDRQLLV